MKSTLKISNMKTLRDVSMVRNAISQNEGVFACQISREKGEVEIVYDSYFLNLDKVIEGLEVMGFDVI
ncbi:heavy-metal-associated domain-containing protein [Clostridium akagii]|uniref:heavy-metal-associated domain-containing protein n=1 Tax=Clostridium akagii TaxID=91623 RepID=UPI000478E341|nr:heavy-metal-associated domain-containing protein [Clostridium akagii]